MAEGLGYADKKSITQYLGALESKGYVRRRRYGHRAVELVEADPPEAGALSLPLAGVVAAGQPLEAVENIEHLAIRELLAIAAGREHFLLQVAAESRKPRKEIDDDALGLLMAYDWPGNVRELRNVIERAAILCSGKTLRVEESLGGAISRARPTPGSFKKDLHAIERTQILRALKTSNWKIKGTGGAADRLGLKPSTLRSRMQRLGISRP